MSTLRLLALAIRDFRNLESVDVSPAAGTTIAVGQNGQGKTNWLEAIYFLCTLKPLRSSRLAELLRFGTAASRVTGRFSLGGAEREIAVEIEAGARRALVDGKRAPSLEAYFGGVSVVAFTPDDLEVVKGAPARRRWFLDRAVFNRFPAFLKESRAYARALKGRNRLLQQRAQATYLRAYDEALAVAGARIWTRRASLLAELASRAAAAFDAIGRSAVPARFSYRPEEVPLDFGWGEERLSGALLASLTERRLQDAERGFTSVGPHVDDLAIEFGGRAARRYASQGQQRALVLAWKIAEVENLREAHGFLPLLLLDDVSSELDPERNAYLMAYLAKSGAQVFLTTTDPSLVRAAARENSVWYEVASGQIALRTPPPGT